MPIPPTLSIDPTKPKAFEPKPVLQYAATAGATGAGIGLFVSTIQNALGNHSQGALGVFTRTGGTIGFIAAMGATYAGTEALVRNTREQDDALNGAAGGCAAGFLAGLRQKSLPMAFGGCALLGGAVGLFEFTGELGGDKLESKEARRARFFKTPPPTLSQTEAPSA